MLPALAGLVVGLAYAAISIYWAVGGRWLLNTAGISLSRPGQAGHLAALLAVWGAAAFKAVAADRARGQSQYSPAVGNGQAATSVGRCGAMNAPPGSSSPVSSKITTPLQSRLQPCSGWLAMVCAASRSGAEGAGQGGVCGHVPVPLGFMVPVFGWC
jgi:hypothetical protein